MRLTGMKVISGGQTGVDLAALRAAQSMGFRTGGEAPLQWRTQHGSKPELTKFGLVEGRSFGYGERTEANVALSDATMLIYTNGDSPGTVQTRTFAKKCDKPLLEIQLQAEPDYDSIEKWLKITGIAASALYGGFTLNVAGNSSMSSPGIFVPSFKFLLGLFYKIASGPGPHDDRDRKQIFDHLNNLQIVHQLMDNFEYIQQLDFRNRHHGVQQQLVIVDPADKS